MKKRFKIVLLLLLICVVSGFWWIQQREPLRQADCMKKATGSQFIQLSEGWTEFSDRGPREGETLILVHGFSVPMFFWEPLERRLLAKGFRVLMYNQYGRGYSSRPNAAYDRAMYIQQLHELMDSLHISKAHLIGQSMGAALAGHFATKYPERTSSVVLLSPMLDKVSDNGGGLFCRTPLIGCPMTNLLIANIVYKRSNELVYTCENVPHEEWLANMREQAKIKGFRHSLITLFHSDALENYGSSYEKLGELSLPTMMVIGGRDTSIPQEHFAIIDSSLPQTSPLLFPENNHVVLIQQIDAVSDSIVSFIRHQSLNKEVSTPLNEEKHDGSTH